MIVRAETKYRLSGLFLCAAVDQHCDLSLNVHSAPHDLSILGKEFVSQFYSFEEALKLRDEEIVIALLFMSAAVLD